MSRYLTLSWNARRTEQAEAADCLQRRIAMRLPDWRAVLDVPGCRVYCPPTPAHQATVTRLEGGAGVVIGILFRRNRDQSQPSERVGQAFGVEESRKILQSRGRHLVQEYWGDYVAVISQEQSHMTHALRGPLANIACYHVHHDGIGICFSSISDWLTLGLGSLSVSWGFVARSINRTVRATETGLVEISRVDHGECLSITGRGTQRAYYWDLVGAAQGDPIVDTNDAVVALREGTRACVRAWGAQYESILLRLSGGLDSSIVLSCVKDLPFTTVRALNRYSSGADSDERFYARAAAHKCGCELIELERNSRFDVRALMDARPTELPRAYFAMLGQLLAEHDVARQTQAQAIFAGTAGDEVYFGGGEALAAVDYFHDHGVRGKLFDVARSAADLEYRSIWSVLRQAVRQGFGDQCWEIHGDVRRTSPLVNWNVVEQFTEQEPGRYPWYDKARYFPPGKQQQIGRLSFAADRGGDSSYPVPGDPEHVTPLFSQPLIETCLRIPSYVLTGDGINRPLARKAFADALPREVLERRTKGGQELYTADIVNRNLPFFRELMLDGQLVRHGFLDRKKLESAMSGGPSGVMRGMSKLSKHICLEVWLALWRKQNQARLAETPRHAVETAQA